MLVQTRLPENPVFSALRAQDYVLFAQHELAQRELFGLPPCGFQAAVRADAPAMADAVSFLNAVRAETAPLLPENVWQSAAVPMLMARLAGRERAQVFVESADRKALHRALSLWAHALSQSRTGSVRWHMDVDVQEM